jgi:hypothetical protein
VRRPAALAIALVAIAACSGGSSGAPERATTSSTTSTPEVAAAPSAAGCTGEPSANGDGLTLSVLPAGQVADGEVRWVLTVRNQASKPVDLVFPSSRHGDVLLIGPDGGQAYLWSADRAFAQAVECQRIPAGGLATYELDGRLEIAPGTYAVTATVVAAPAPPAFGASITVTG